MRFPRVHRSTRERLLWILGAVLSIGWCSYWLATGEETAPVRALYGLLIAVWLWIGYVEARELRRAHRARR